MTKRYRLAGFITALIATSYAGVQATQEKPNTVVVDWNKLCSSRNPLRRCR